MGTAERIGVVGSGFIAKQLVTFRGSREVLALSKVLTRTDGAEREDLSRQNLLTNSLDKVIRSSDLIVLRC